MNLFVLDESLKTNNMFLENTNIHSSKISKIPIVANHGDFILYENTNNVKSIIFADSINQFRIKLVNDLGETVLENSDFTMSLKFEITEMLDDDSKISGKLSNFNIPIVNKEVYPLYNTREIQEINLRNSYKKLDKTFIYDF